MEGWMDGEILKDDENTLWIDVVLDICKELGRKEGNVLFNDALNTFYLRLYGVRHMVKDHDSEREETRCRHMGYSFRLAARVLLYAPSHRQEDWLEQEIAQWVHPAKDRSEDPSHHE